MINHSPDPNSQTLDAPPERESFYQRMVDAVRKIRDHPNLVVLVVVFLLFIFLVLSLTSARSNTLTYDEDAHFRYGMQILNGNSDRFDDSKMPFSAINALPAKVIEMIKGSGALSIDQQVALGRMVTVLFSIVIAFFVFRWSTNLYGVFAGVLVLIFYIFEPNLLAHSQLVTTDVYAAGMVLLSAYALWRFSRRRTWQNVLLLAVVLGVSQLAKYTSIFLFPILAAVLIIRDLPEISTIITARDKVRLWRYLKGMLFLAIMVIVISIVVINVGFLFNKTMTPLGDYQFRSTLFQSIQSRLAFMNRVPVPTPYPYLEGLDWVVHNERTGANYSRIYLFEQLSETGFKGYYFFAFLYKVPLAIQLVLIIALVMYFARRKTDRFLQDEIFLFVPVLFFTIYFNFFYRAQIGIRFFLVVFPLLFVFCGSLFKKWQTYSLKYRIGVAALAVYLIVSVLSYYPHYIPYFNELVLDRKLSYKILADSNLDWGQAGNYVEQFLEQHPDALIEPTEPTAGLVLISSNNLVGITAKPETYAWLREGYQPDDTIAYAILVYELAPEDVNHP